MSRQKQYNKRKPSDVICFKCNKPGHIGAKCPNLKELYAEKECLLCRQKGHGYRFCPNNLDVGDVKCYTCGKVGHASRNCPDAEYTNTKESKYRYAECFICKNVGHLSSQCPENQNKSIYPRGGSCFACGGTDHLSKHCPNRTEEEVMAEWLERAQRIKEERELAKKLGGKSDDRVDLGDDETKQVKSTRKVKEDKIRAEKAEKKRTRDEEGGGFEAVVEELNSKPAKKKKKTTKE